MSINETLDKLASLPAGERIYHSDLVGKEETSLTTDELKELAEWVTGVQEMHEDAERIALCINEHDKLVAEVERLKAENERLQTKVDTWLGVSQRVFKERQIHKHGHEYEEVQLPTLKELDFPPNELFFFADSPGEHDPCFVVMPGRCSLPLNHHNTPGVDIARAKFIIDACNAALSLLHDNGRDKGDNK